MPSDPVKNQTQSVVEALSERGHLLLGETAPPRSVTVRQQGAAALATLQFDKRQRRVVVKGIPPDAIIGSLDDLFATHQRIRAASARLAECLPRFLGVIRERDLIVIEYVPGPTLEALLNRAFLPRQRRTAAAGIVATAEALAEFHRWRAVDVGVPWAPRANRSYLPDMESYWKASALVDSLEEQYSSLDTLTRHLKSGFFDRKGDRLMPYDSQPKNVIVDPEGRVSFVDLDYLGGNPAISVAAFLGSLDRIGLRHPPGISSPLTRAWKRAFLRAYCSKGADAVIEDLVFFYPWTLVQQHDSIVASRPLFRSYVGRYYGRRVRDFLNALDSTPWDQICRAPELLFQGRSLGLTNVPSEEPRAPGGLEAAPRHDKIAVGATFSTRGSGLQPAHLEWCLNQIRHHFSPDSQVLTVQAVPSRIAEVYRLVASTGNGPTTLYLKCYPPSQSEADLRERFNYLALITEAFERSGVVSPHRVINSDSQQRLLLAMETAGESLLTIHRALSHRIGFGSAAAVRAWHGLGVWLGTLHWGTVPPGQSATRVQEVLEYTRERFQGWMEQDSTQRDRAERALQTVESVARQAARHPVTITLCHGDVSAGNVIVGREVSLVDPDDLRLDMPAVDLSQALMELREFGFVASVLPLPRFSRTALSSFLAGYGRALPQGPEFWLPHLRNLSVYLVTLAARRRGFSLNRLTEEVRYHRTIQELDQCIKKVSASDGAADYLA